MLFKRDVLERIVRGEVTLAFRRWKRPTVKAGGRLRTPAGVPRIGAVDRIGADELTDRDACAAGYRDGGSALKALGSEDGGALWRIELGGLDADERAALREATGLSEAEWTELRARFDRWEKTAPGYHRSILDLIGRRPGIPAAVLAETLGVDKQKFKRGVRALKELGLTESLDTGYRLSPRGVHVLKRLAGAP